MGSKTQQKGQAAPAPVMDGRGRGTVQHMYPERGFGFIKCTEGSAADVGQDFFFHQSGLVRPLTMHDLLPGSLVEFDSTDVPRGKRAERITLV